MSTAAVAAKLPERGMRSPALFATLLIFPLLAGCPISTPCFGVPPVPAGPPTANTGVVDQQVTLVLDVPPAASCGNGSTPPREVEWIEVEVLSPSNEAVTNTASGLQTAVVRFTPIEAGRYHVTAHFQPNLGKASASIEIFGRGGLQPLTVLPRDCSLLERFGDEALVCDDRIFSIDGGFLFQVTGTRHAVVEDVAWSWHPTTGISRRVLDGGALQLTGTLSSVPSGVDPDSLVAFRDALYLAADSNVHRFESAGTQIRLTQSEFFTQLSGAVTLVAGTDRAFVFDERSRGATCGLTTDGGELFLDACRQTDAGLLGHARDALYLTEERDNFGGGFGANPVEVVRVGFKNHDGIQRVAAPETPSPVVFKGFRGPILPVWKTNDGPLLPRFRDGALSLELLTGIDAGFTASEDLVWEKVGGNTIVYRRQ